MLRRSGNGGSIAVGDTVLDGKHMTPRGDSASKPKPKQTKTPKTNTQEVLGKENIPKTTVKDVDEQKAKKGTTKVTPRRDSLPRSAKKVVGEHEEEHVHAGTVNDAGDTNTPEGGKTRIRTPRKSPAKQDKKAILTAVSPVGDADELSKIEETDETTSNRDRPRSSANPVKSKAKPEIAKAAPSPQIADQVTIKMSPQKKVGKAQKVANEEQETSLSPGQKIRDGEIDRAARQTALPLISACCKMDKSKKQLITNAQFALFRQSRQKANVAKKNVIDKEDNTPEPQVPSDKQTTKNPNKGRGTHASRTAPLNKVKSAPPPTKEAAKIELDSDSDDEKISNEDTSTSSSALTDDASDAEDIETSESASQTDDHTSLPSSSKSATEEPPKPTKAAQAKGKTGNKAKPAQCHYVK